MAAANQANRGKGLESMLDQLHQVYAARGWASIDRTPQPIKRLKIHPGMRLPPGAFVAVYGGDGPPDYRGSVAPSGRSVVFDAKMSAGARWPLKHLEPHQAKDLDLALRTGAYPFVLLYISGRTWVLPWTTLAPMWWYWHRGEAARGEASISTAELPTLGHPCAAGGWLPVVRQLLEAGA